MHLSHFLYILKKHLNNKIVFDIYLFIKKNDLICPLNKEQLLKFININSYNQINKSIADFDENLLPKFISIADYIYPSLLKEIYNPPTILYYEGNLELLNEELITIVGARDNDSEGERILSELIPKIANQKYTLVSGLARGIDSLSQRLMIANSSKTIAVIGNGINVNYPIENSDLQNEIKINHLILSEYENYQRPKQHHFIARNRILAGLSKNIIIVQSQKKSGTMLTAELAILENRDILTFPGSIFNKLFEGNNYLIEQGAYPIISTNDIFLTKRK